MHPGALQARQHPLPDPLPFELRYGSEDVHLELPRGRRRVDPFRQTHERDAERLEFVEERDQVLQVAPESIQPPAHEHVEPPPPGVRQQLVEGGAPILRPAHPFVQLLGGRPAPRLRVPPQLLELIFRLLIDGADPRVDGGLYALTSRSAVPALRIRSATFSTRWAERSGIGLPVPHQA